MQSGKLRFRVTIQQGNETTDGEGEQVQSWTAFKQRWADIRTITGKEYYTHDTTKVQAAQRVFIRWTDGVTESMRILWGTRILNIVHIGEDRTHERMMILSCEETK